MDIPNKVLELNSRLETCFALKRRLENERLRIHKKVSDEITEIKRLHTIQLGMLEKDPEEQSIEIDHTTLKTDNQTQCLTIKKMEKDLDAQNKRYKLLEETNISLLSKLGEERKESRIAEECCEETVHQLALKQVSNQSLDENLASYSKKLEDRAPDLQGETKRLQKLKEKLRLMQAMHKDELVGYQVRVDKLNQTTMEKEMKIKKYFEEKVGKIQCQALIEKEKVTKEVKTYYENEFRKIDTEIVQREQEVDLEQKETTRLRLTLQHCDSIEVLKRQIAELTQTSIAKENTLSELQKKYQESVKLLQDISHNNFKKYATAKQMANDLAPEVKAYKLLVETMERYSPSPKKKRKNPSVARKTPQKTPKKLFKELVRIEEWRENYITVKNVGHSVVPLSGWRLKSDATKTEFSFPKCELRSQSLLKIWTKADDAKKCDNDFMWQSIKNQLIPQKEEIQLIDPSGEVKNFVNIVCQN